MTSAAHQGLTVGLDYNRYLADGSGTIDAIVRIAADPAAFAVHVATAISMSIPDLTLRLRTPVGARVGFVEQVAPTTADLTDRRVEVDRQIGEYLLGAWGLEDREYHLQVEVEPAPAGRSKRAVHVSFVTGERILGEGHVTVEWTADSAQAARINHRVAYYTGQTELAEAVREGLSARESGDTATATARLQRALELAVAAGNDGTARLLKPMIETTDQVGTALLRREAVAADAVAAPQTGYAPVPVEWVAIVAADREFHERVAANGGPDAVDFPHFFAERRISLTSAATVIGRRNRGQGVEPEIDLGIHPSDRGVSTQHAVLRIRGSGPTITDLGSTNGTSLNGGDDLLRNGEEIALADGDRIHVGAWTTITVRHVD